MSIIMMVSENASTDELMSQELTPEERLRLLEPLLDEVVRRAEKEWADSGEEFTVTIDPEMWQRIKGAL